MRGKKLTQRLNKIQELLLERGIGTFCDCPHPEDTNIARFLYSAFQVEFVEEPIVTCSEHRPRPVRKPEASYRELLLKFFPNGPYNDGEPINVTKVLRPSRFADFSVTG